MRKGIKISACKYWDWCWRRNWSSYFIPSCD